MGKLVCSCKKVNGVSGVRFKKTGPVRGTCTGFFWPTGFCQLQGMRNIYAIAAILLAIVQASCEKKSDLPQEALVFDDTIEWEWELGAWYGGNSFYWWHRPAESGVTNYGNMHPDDWERPNDFRKGTFYFRFEVLEQPADSAFNIQFGIWQDLEKAGGYSETVSSLAYLQGGSGSMVETSLGSPASWWQKREDEPVDFRRPQDFYRIGIVLWKDSPLCLPMAQGWSNPNACADPETEALNFFPMKARVTVVAVAEGHEFSGWENYRP
jgi:hypothetical protein